MCHGSLKFHGLTWVMLSLLWIRGYVGVVRDDERVVVYDVGNEWYAYEV